MNRYTTLGARLLAATLLACLPGTFAQAAEAGREEARLITATQVLDELRATPDQNVPDWLLQRAYGIAVIPEVIKAAFVFGGRHGNGVLSVRDASGRFSNPIFITLTGGSVGWQIGATSTDVVLVFVTARSVENFARGKFTLGADASVAAGPVGRQAQADAGVHAEIYSYSRSRGLFAGVALDGTVIAFDSHGNDAYYQGNEVTTTEITTGKVTSSAESTRRFLAAVAASANGASSEASGGASAPGAAAPPPPAPTPAAGAAPSNPGGVKTYPMEDAQPGSEPK
jgi:lipid-binding SYLF domain-containing protein